VQGFVREGQEFCGGKSGKVQLLLVTHLPAATASRTDACDVNQVSTFFTSANDAASDRLADE
jgi:hypothetical protein